MFVITKTQNTFLLTVFREIQESGSSKQVDATEIISVLSYTYRVFHKHGDKLVWTLICTGIG